MRPGASTTARPAYSTGVLDTPSHEGLDPAVHSADRMYGQHAGNHVGLEEDQRVHSDGSAAWGATVRVAERRAPGRSRDGVPGTSCWEGTPRTNEPSRGAVAPAEAALAPRDRGRAGEARGDLQRAERREALPAAFEGCGFGRPHRRPGARRDDLSRPRSLGSVRVDPRMGRGRALPKDGPSTPQEGVRDIACSEPDVRDLSPKARGET